MSKLSKKAVLSVLTLVLAFVALGATTFAWFSLGTTATVGQFDVQVKGSEGLEIRFAGFDTVDSEDNSIVIGESNDWFTTINSANMNQYIKSVFDGRLDAVTSKNGKDFVKMTGITENEGKGTVDTGLAVANTDYLEFKLQFRTKSENQQLVLLDLTLSSEKITWKADTAFKTENDDDEVEAGADLETYPHYAARVVVDGDDNLFAYEYETAAASGDLLPNLVLGEDDYVLEKGAHNYVAVKHGLDTLNAPATKRLATVTTVSNDELVVFGTKQADGHHYAEVIIRVWIEGWDPNAYDIIFDGELHIGFVFELKEITP